MEYSIYRIIDANFNRAREACRMIEEYCRFALDCQALSARTKKLRHQLCDLIKNLDSSKLLTSRDTVADIGTALKVDNQLTRSDLCDCLTAACKRLPEALRALSETTQTIDPLIAKKIETLRYDSYTLEKDINIFSSTTEKFKKVKLYIVITSDLSAEALSLTEKCIAGQADCIQLRTKNLPDDQLLALATKFVNLCKDANIISIINDRADIAIASFADGVHLGQNDIPITQARKLQQYPLIIGISTHSPQQLKAACSQNPTYVALGPVFKTTTKPDLEPVTLNYVKQAAEILKNCPIPSVAIGAITSENVTKVLDAGANAIAVCSAVTKSPDPQAACKKLKDAINAHKGKR